MPISAVGGFYATHRSTVKVAAKTDKVHDDFGTVQFWNEYKKIKIYGYQGCPYCAKGFLLYLIFFN